MAWALLRLAALPDEPDADISDAAQANRDAALALFRSIGDKDGEAAALALAAGPGSRKGAGR